MRCLGVVFCGVLVAWSAVGLEPPKNGQLYVIAHRGVHAGIPENTLAAYREAIRVGCDFVEIDLRTTKDGALVSVHNREVDAYTKDAKGLVRDFTLAELIALDIGSRVGPEWAEERIPTFEEILQVCQGKIGIYLDVKEAELEKALVLVRKYGMEGSVLWLSGWRKLEQLGEACPECVLMPDPGTRKMLPRLLERFPEPAVVAPVWRSFTADFSGLVHAQGGLVFVDDDDGNPEEWAQAVAWGADGIQTDQPAALLKWLKSRESR